MGQALKLKYFLAGLLAIIVTGFFYIDFHYSSSNPAPFYTDLTLHFLGGIFVTALAVYLLIINKITLSNNRLVNAILLVSIATFIGVLWEFYEYEVAAFALKQHDPVDDTLSDILMDMLGGTAFALFYKLKALIPDSK